MNYEPPVVVAVTPIDDPMILTRIGSITCEVHPKWGTEQAEGS